MKLMFFLFNEYLCGLRRGITTCFKVLEQRVIHTLTVRVRPYTCLFWTIICNLYLSMRYFGIMWNKTKMYLYLYMDILRLTPCMYLYMYLIPVKDKIMFHRSFTFSCHTIRVVIFPGQLMKSTHMWVIPNVSLLSVV